ncbi:MAG: hypothetical protein PHQ62_02980 [Clostridia bacterium]|nr:hypothetical protein [Clostridia bacterium]
MIKFGTSGFRGVFADTFTKENVQKIGFALTKHFKNNLSNWVYVGYDNRFMGKQFAMWISEVLVAYGAKVMFYNKSVPSTLIAFQTKNLDFGVHITASHNPYTYNGIKIFLKNGCESTTETNDNISKIANKKPYKKIRTMDFESAVKNGNIAICQDIKTYCNSMLKFAFKIKQNNPKVLFNAMHGSSVECMEYVLEKSGVKFKTINQNIDPFFENMLPAPYEKNLQDQINMLKSGDFDFGFALDGDGDRISFLDKDGTFYDCNYVSALFFQFFLKNKKLKGGMVKNCALTELVNKIAKENNCKIFDAKVGFKNVAKAMQENPDILLGAESNGIAIGKHILHKDGLLSALIMIEIFATYKKSLKEIIADLKKQYKYPCEVAEFAYSITEQKRQEILQKVFANKNLPQTPQPILQAIYDDGAKFVFENGYWAVIRFSGTENVVRIFAEMKNKQECNKYIKIFEDFISVKTRQ